MNQKYISFGPSCLAADILKWCNLRVCTFGFDWFRSGSYHHALFFRLKTKDFLKFHVNQLSYPLRQIGNPNNTLNKTSEFKPLQHLYGYEVLYNPHRNYDEISFMYFGRAFNRLENRLDSNQGGFKKPVLLMADYLNKEHCIHFHDTSKAAVYLQNNCLLRYGYIPEVKIIRLKIVDERDFFNKSMSTERLKSHIEHTVPITKKIDDDKSIRRVFFKSLVDILS